MFDNPLLAKKKKVQRKKGPTTKTPPKKTVTAREGPKARKTPKTTPKKSNIVPKAT